MDLLVKAGADLNARDSLGRGPLHQAVLAGNERLLQVLTVSRARTCPCRSLRLCMHVQAAALPPWAWVCACPADVTQCGCGCHPALQSRRQGPVKLILTALREDQARASPNAPWPMAPDLTCLLVLICLASHA